jgi:hypothetical protein
VKLKVRRRTSTEPLAMLSSKVPEVRRCDQVLFCTTRAL